MSQRLNNKECNIFKIPLKGPFGSKNYACLFFVKDTFIEEKGKKQKRVLFSPKKVKNDVIGFTIKPLTNDVRGL